MSILKTVLKKILIKLSGNRWAQDVLERNVQALQYLMGIGSGGEVATSGEQAIVDILKKRGKPPYCIFDVGANKGQFLGLMLGHIKADFSIHCFEPGSETFEMLARSFKEDKRVRLNNIGIGQEKGEAVLYFNSAGSGLASLTKRRLGHFGIDFNRSEKVRISTIDGYCLENSIDHIDLLKIDIEGHELDALTGAKRMLAAQAIDIITFEFGGCNIDTRTFFQDFWYFLSDHNMKIFRITPSGYLRTIGSYQEVHEQFRTMNFIAISGE